jgi:hypothetical protein
MTEKLWSAMTPQERRTARFQKWLSPPGLKFNNKQAADNYKVRTQRLIDAIELKKTPDRVPVILPMGFFPAYNAGLDLKTVMYDARAMRQAWKSILKDFDMDVVDAPNLVWSGEAYELLQHKLYKWPGHGLADDATSYQYVEGEYMKSNEYDALLHNGMEYGQRVFLPRIMGVMESFKDLPAYSPINGMPMGYLMSFSKPEVRQTYRTLLKVGELLNRWGKTVAESKKDAVKAGFPILRGSFSTAPLDTLGDTLRGTQGIIMDMYRQPQKILEALEVITPINIAHAVAAVNASECPIVSIPLHKGEDNFMSRAQYEKFYWPTFRRLLMGLIEEGIVPLCFAEGRYKSRLDIIKDIPKGSMIWWFEQTDMGLAKQALKDVACIAGNIPVSVLVTGQPADVKEYCRKVIEAAKEGGGLILNGAAFMHKGNPENLRVMLEAAREYGTYQ